MNYSEIRCIALRVLQTSKGSEGGVNANHNVTCSPNDSRLLKNSEGNRVGEWIFCRREGGRCCFILASDNNKKRSEKSVKQTLKLVDYCPKEDHHKTTNLETRNKQNGSKSTNHESQTVTFWTRASNHLFPKRSAKMIDGTEKNRNPSKRETTNFAITETKLFGKTYLIIASS